MAQQSTTRPREAPKQQGPKTREMQKRIINKEERTDASDAPSPGETLKQADKRYPKPGPGSAYHISTGDRSIPRGENDPSEHDKRSSEK